MKGLGRFVWNPVSAVPAALILLFSCAGTPESKHDVSDASSHEKLLSQESGEAEKSAETINRDSISEEPIDPFEEVSRLWYGGYPVEARMRFWLDDVRALAGGERHSEWSIWRGRLFIESWSGYEVGLAGENISALLVDHDDIWAGTWTGGISRLSCPLNDYTLWDPGQPSLAVRTVNSINRYGDTVWVVRYGAVEHYDLRTGIWSHLVGLPVTERLQDIYISENGTYLATLGHGIWHNDGSGWVMMRTPGLFITNFEPGPADDLIVMTMDRGLYLLDTVTGGWNRPPSGFLREVNVTSAVAGGNIIYGGTYGFGAFVWNTESDEVTHFDSGELGDPYVLTVALSKRRVFFGTFGAGLVSWNLENETWDRVSLEEGLPSADIAALEVDEEGNVWAGTLGGGIVKISGGIHGD